MDSQRSKGMSWADEDACWDSKMAENRHGSKQDRFGVQVWSKSNKIACTGLQNRPRGPSRGILNSAAPPRRPHLCLCGPRAGLRIPRRIPRRLSLSPPRSCLRGARVALQRPRADRGLTAGRLSSPSPRTVVAGFREPRELRGDSDRAGVWFGSPGPVRVGSKC